MKNTNQQLCNIFLRTRHLDRFGERDCTLWGIQTQPALEDFTAGYHLEQKFSTLAVISEHEEKFIFAAAARIFNFMLCMESLTTLILKQVVFKLWNGCRYTHMALPSLRRLVLSSVKVLNGDEMFEAFDDFEFCQILCEISKDVEDLRFENMSIRFAMPDGRLTVSLKFPKVKALEISKCEVIQPIDYCGPVLIGFPQRFPVLEKLVCKTSTIPNLFTYELPDLISLGRLKYLELDDDDDLQPLLAHLSNLKLNVVRKNFQRLEKREETNFNDENFDDDETFSTSTDSKSDQTRQKQFLRWLHDCFSCIRKKDMK